MQGKNISRQRFGLNPRGLSRGYSIPIAVLVLGVISIAMLLWIYLINEKQRNDVRLSDALMDIQNLAASSHLWLEEAIGGNEGVEVQKIKDDLDLAINLAEAVLNGGISDHGERIKPVPKEDSKWRESAEQTKSLLVKFKGLILKRLEPPLTTGIGSSLDKDIDAVYKEIEIKAYALEKVFEREQHRAQANWRRIFIGILLAWVGIVGGSTIGLYRHETQRRAAEMELEKANEQLQSQAGELKKYKENLEDLVEKRTMDLVTANWQLEKEIIERKETEKSLRASESQLRHLSSKLFSAQEEERKRISRELHDELGGMLASLKMDSKIIKDGLREDQIELKDTCGSSIEVIDLLINNVSRLSRNLSPYLLEELGLSAALQRLVNGFSQRFLNVTVNLDILDIDRLFPVDAQIVIYRIIQESLANAAKYSKAKNISVRVEQRNGMIRFLVEDDGKGFDVKKVSTKDVSERGMGLTIIDERVRMLDGTLDLRSQEGKGTRVTISIPVKKTDS